MHISPKTDLTCTVEKCNGNVYVNVSKAYIANSLLMNIDLNHDM